MPPASLRLLSRLSVLAVVVCSFGVLAGLLLAFSPFASELPIQREEALGVAGLAGLGLVLSGAALWWLGRELDRA
ncbi:hypothetical protein F8S09_01205 [Deinococcus sp. SDU3-2]|uniref:Uncharacterized protein n=1 Tax=Deinococcus terrestris TaxID=2651870 RepID=A0A7X1NTM4_9DEIO|nr:hypothetical protein [Deinococcus terrestris]MPY65314.1 hypothetical protein [Deinococcus terrestris]